MTLQALRQRWHSLAALGLSAAALITITLLAEVDAPLLNARSLNLAAAQVAYVAVVIAAGFGIALEPRLIRWLGHSALRRGLRAAAALTTVLLLTLLNPSQEARLFQTPASLIVIILHGIGLAALLVDLTGWQSTSERAAAGIITLVIAALVVGHIVSVGAFMRLDLPDEPWLASTATQFAENGDFSPTFIGSAYDSPDVILPRYYALMGLWLRAAGSSLEALRAVPLFTAGLAAGLMIWLLGAVGLRWEQRLSGLAVLLALSAFVRMSHNLRQDILLAVYGAILLAALLMLLRRGGRRWAALAGIALYIGLESIPFMALVLGLSVGSLLLIRAFRDGNQRPARLQAVLIYAAACAAACIVYVGVRALPDPAASLEHYRNFNRVYSGQTALGTLRFPLEGLLSYHARFSLSLAPVEGIVSLTALVLLWRRGDSAERWIISMFGLAFGGAFFIIGVAYGYWVMIAPLVAYASARTLLTARLRIIWLWVLLPALAVPPLLDFAQAVGEQANRKALAEVAPIQAEIPEGYNVLGDDLLWFVLHPARRFVGWGGIGVYMSARQMPDARAALEALDIRAAICSQPEHCTFIESAGLFGQPEPIQLGATTYFIYRR